jgi:hypothetical protein
VDLLHIGTYVRRWLRWARSGLWALGAALAELALDRVVRTLRVGKGLLAGSLPPKRPAVSGPTVGDDGDAPDER